MKDFYKVKNGALVKLKERYIKHNGRIYSNPTEEQLLLAGWKPVAFSEKPEDGIDYYYAPVYEETDNKIIQSWAKQEFVYEEVTE